ncbi:MAG: TetR/AcrR family transcriptional regulator [Cryobacterium sp.]|uniref:TetR/AcrR family transcriptional regulator n=1 Tax=unclassified Cryobacterium TaxID=2649013 RepID=UPI0018C93717|nr:MULTISPECIES: TetR/AcrR family transcriptional regulator [unclassified Cryobacterium]MCY7404700.1 TetR/AcrR family transcriptional regulator [Cryobacterium sp.]MEC5154939.1 AcrR family transcriptional regulator [Cryobacterium sp. CAN_C3]
MTSPTRKPQDGVPAPSAPERTAPLPPRRRDARLNRDRLIASARTLLAQHGVDASLEAIARQAEVGVATLYRNFPTRDDLVRVLYDLALAQLHAVRGEIEAAPTPWEALVIYTERVAEWLVADPSLPPILRRMAVLEPSARPAAEFDGFIASLVARAKRDGTLRRDVDAVDLAVLVTMVGSLGGLGAGYAGQWRRQLSIVLDGLRAADAPRPRLPGRPLNVKEYQATVHGLTRRAARAAL